MIKRIFIFILLFLGIPFSIYASELPESDGLYICAKFKRSVKTKVGGIAKPFYKGEVFKVVDRRKGPDGGAYYIQVLDKKVKINKKVARIGDSKSCGVVGRKILLSNPTVGFTSFTDQGGANSQVYNSGEYVIQSLYQTPDADWIRIDVGGALAYVKQADVDFEYSLDEVLKTQNTAYSLLGFHLYVEAGWSGNQSTERIDSILTDIPLPNDVSDLQDPLITETEEGSGFFLNFYSYPWNLSENVNSYFGLGYSRTTYTYNTLDNEDPVGPIDIDTLTGEGSGEIELEDLLIKLGLMREFGFFGSKVAVSLLAVGKYSMTEEVIINVLEGCDSCIGKREPLDIVSTQKGFDLGFALRADFPIGNMFRISLEVDDDAAFWGSVGFLIL